jgi:hypothetical protein
MKNFKYKKGVKIGSSRILPGRGLVVLTDDVSDEIAQAFIDAGVATIFQAITVKAPKTQKENGDTNEGNE